MTLRHAIPIVLALGSGCATFPYDKGAGLGTLPNTERAFVVDFGDGKAGTKLTRCLEFPGPAAVLQSMKVDTGAKAGGDVAPAGVKVVDGEVSVNVGVDSSAELAHLYTVSSVMQYAHSMMYRACEARRNGDLTNEQYIVMTNAVMANTSDLLSKEIELQREATKAKKIDAIQQLTIDSAEKARLLDAVK
jgi:hypothetical protein